MSAAQEFLRWFDEVGGDVGRAEVEQALGDVAREARAFLDHHVPETADGPFIGGCSCGWYVANHGGIPKGSDGGPEWVTHVRESVRCHCTIHEDRGEQCPNDGPVCGECFRVCWGHDYTTRGLSPLDSLKQTVSKREGFPPRGAEALCPYCGQTEDATWHRATSDEEWGHPFGTLP